VGLKPGHGPSAHQNDCRQGDTSLPNSTRRIRGVYSHGPACRKGGGRCNRYGLGWRAVLIDAMNYEKRSVVLNLPKRCVGNKKIARIASAHTNKPSLAKPIDCRSSGVAARESD
jgi:hypothetical protein